MILFPFLRQNTLEEIIGWISRVVQLRQRDIIEIDTLQQLNSYTSGFRRETITTTANYSIGIDDLYIDVNAAGGDRTVTLSNAPIDGQTHIIARTNVGGNKVTINGNGKNINGVATVVLNGQYQVRHIVYMGGS